MDRFCNLCGVHTGYYGARFCNLCGVHTGYYGARCTSGCYEGLWLCSQVIAARQWRHQTQTTLAAKVASKTWWRLLLWHLWGNSCYVGCLTTFCAKFLHLSSMSTFTTILPGYVGVAVGGDSSTERDFSRSAIPESYLMRFSSH